MEEKSKKKLLLSLLPESGCMLLAAAGIYGMSFIGLLEQAADKMICHMVLCVVGVGIVGFFLRENRLHDGLDYDNARHVGRFWLWFLLGLAAAFVCALLPAAAWPFLPIFVALTLFSDLNTGVLAGVVLLMVPAGLTESGPEIFILYAVSGFFGAMLFQRLESDSKTALPIAFSLGCLLVCLTAGTVLTANARLGLEYFVVPVANLIISGLLLFGILKYFFAKTIYFYRDSYLELNDPENEILATLRQEDKSAYLKGVHTAHFCERIAVQLNLNADALKCAAYYYGMGEELPNLLQEYAFPPETVRTLEDYKRGRKRVQYRETAVLMAADDVISMVLRRVAEKRGDPVDYDAEIDAIFQGYYDEGTFFQCDIAVRDMQVMKRIFKEEKFYYDFLH